jgi:hypothetical protein
VFDSTTYNTSVNLFLLSGLLKINLFLVGNLKRL